MAGQDLDWDHSVGEDLLRREEHNGYSSAPYSGIDFFNGFVHLLMHTSACKLEWRSAIDWYCLGILLVLLLTTVSPLWYVCCLRSTLNDSMMDQSNGVFLSQRQFAYLLRILGEANDLLVEQNHLKHHQMPVVCTRLDFQYPSFDV